VNSTDARQDRKNKQAWHCHKCEELVPDAELFLVGDGQTGEAIVLHRACVASLLAPRVSRKLASRTVSRRRARAKSHSWHPRKRESSRYGGAPGLVCRGRYIHTAASWIRPRDAEACRKCLAVQLPEPKA
jgi:hypothetical protein